MRLYYELTEPKPRVICVDAPQRDQKRVLAREGATGAKPITKDEFTAKIRQVQPEWYDLNGSF